MFGYIKFASANLVVYVGEILLTLLFTERFDLWYLQSYTLALLIGTFVLFFYHNHITFKIKKDYHRITYFFMVSTVVILLNLSTVYIINRLVHLYYLVMIIVVAPFYSVVNYMLNKRFVFNGKADDQ